MLEQRIQIGSVFRRNGDADGGGDGNWVAIKQERFAEDLHQLAGHDCCRFWSFHLAQQHKEFVAALTRERVRPAHNRTETAGNIAQELVADGVTEGVIHILESVEVDEEQRIARIVALCGGSNLLEPIGQQKPVGQASQEIMVRHVLDARFVGLGFGDVREGGDVVGDLTAIITDGAERQPFREDLVVLAAVPDFALPEPLGMQGLPHASVELLVLPAA